MVAAQDEEVLGVLDLVGEQQADRLEGLFAAVDVVAEEEVVCFGWEAAVLEQSQQVVVLSVDVAANLASLSAYVWTVHVIAIRHTLIGASSSSRMGWEMKISRALVQRYRISVSSSWTCLPGRLPRTSRRRSMMESRSTSFWSAMAGEWCKEDRKS